jgi:methionine salvage enolase-phosphatase E1
MSLHWLITGTSLVVALLAWRRARRNAKQLERLTQMYWELKYQHGELRAQLQHGDAMPSPREAPREPAVPGGAFIPLISLKR